jgi:hypothetical protein
MLLFPASSSHDLTEHPPFPKSKRNASTLKGFLRAILKAHDNQTTVHRHFQCTSKPAGRLREVADRECAAGVRTRAPSWTAPRWRPRCATSPASAAWARWRRWRTAVRCAGRCARCCVPTGCRSETVERLARILLRVDPAELDGDADAAVVKHRGKRVDERVAGGADGRFCVVGGAGWRWAEASSVTGLVRVMRGPCRGSNPAGHVLSYRCAGPDRE